MKDMFSAIAEGALLFTFIFLLKRIYELTDLFVTGGTSLIDTLQLLSAILPTIMLLTFPMAILLAAMMVYGRIAQDNELTALQAAGYSTPQLLIPALLIGILVTSLLLWWGHRIAPKGIRLFESLAANILQDTASAGIRPGGFNQLGDYIIVPNAVDERERMLNIRMFEHQNDRIASIISAPTGVLRYEPRENSISLMLEKGSIHRFPESGNLMGIQFDRFDFSIGISGLLRKLAKAAREEYKLSDSNLRFAINNPPPPSQANLYRWWIQCKIEMARRTALPFACLIMAGLGALLGIISGRGKRSSCYAMTITIIFIYYILLNFGKSFAEAEVIPATVALWLPNVVSLAIASYLYFQTLRV